MKRKIKKLFVWQRVLAVMALCGLIAYSQLLTARAQSVTESFGSDQNLQRGMIVKLNQDDSEKVEAVSQDSAHLVYGVVIDANDAPLTLSEENKPFFVATIGSFDVLVSTQEGPVDKGDYIAVSSIDGIGMAATQRDETIVGIALGDFDGSKDVVSTPTLKRPSGQEEVIPVGRVKIDIGIGRNPNYQAPEPNVPTALRRLSAAVAGKEVSAFRVYVGTMIFLITSLVVMSMLYAGIRSSIVSIGRNPLGKKGIIKGMLQVIITGLIVFISGLVGVYLILRL